jgi:hypothetical protein
MFSKQVCEMRGKINDFMRRGAEMKFAGKKPCM